MDKRPHIASFESTLVLIKFQVINLNLFWDDPAYNNANPSPGIWQVYSHNIYYRPPTNPGLLYLSKLSSKEYAMLCEWIYNKWRFQREA